MTAVALLALLLGCGARRSPPEPLLDDQPLRVQHAGVLRVDVRLDRDDHAVLDEHVRDRVMRLGRADDPAASNQDLQLSAPPPDKR